MQTEVARSIAECCRFLAASGMIAGADGNVSVRIDSERLLTTPSGILKAGLTADEIVEVDIHGRQLGGSSAPTNELDMHLRIYRERQDVFAVVHAHPPTATGFGVAGLKIDDCVLPELILLMGQVPLVPYGAPGTPELGEAMEPFIADNDAMLLANHGAVTVGKDLKSARIRMESLEHAAKVLFTARMLGQVNPLEREQLERLEAMRQEFR